MDEVVAHVAGQLSTTGARTFRVVRPTGSLAWEWRGELERLTGSAWELHRADAHATGWYLEGIIHGKRRVQKAAGARVSRRQTYAWPTDPVVRALAQEFPSRIPLAARARRTQSEVVLVGVRAWTRPMVEALLRALPWDGGASVSVTWLPGGAVRAARPAVGPAAEPGGT